jgi:hypothetical protein
MKIFIFFLCFNIIREIIQFYILFYIERNSKQILSVYLISILYLNYRLNFQDLELKKELNLNNRLTS